MITILIVVSFAIEIGQGYTGTGNMDLDDIISGLAGFMLLFVIFAVIRGFLLLIGGLFKKEPDDDDSRFSSGR